MGNDIVIRVYRSVKNSYQDYTLEKTQGMTILGALIEIHEKQDETLSIDYNCRAGRCGTCGVLVNGKPTLACETQVPENADMLTIDPKRNHRIIKDVMTEDPQIWGIRKNVLEKHAFSPKTEPPYVIPPHQIEKFHVLDSCIECGLCQSACPNFSKGWIGPMHAVYVAKLDAHPLDTLDRSELLMTKGMGLCDTNFACQKSCPKGITIAQDGIIPEKEGWLDRNGILSRIFRKKSN